MDSSDGTTPQLISNSNVAKDEFVFPVSFAQQRLWILDQFEPGNPAYNVSTAYRLTGELKVQALEDSLNTILQRHEALRTTFSIQNDEPVQVVAPFRPTSLSINNLEHLSASKQGAEITRLLAEISHNSFNLSKGPLFQVSLIKLASREHILIFNMHHIVTDGWSLDILLQELSSLYSAYINKLSNPLPDLPIQYPDFSVWQRDSIHDNSFADHLDYWKKKLTDLPSLEMPLDRPRPTLFSYQGSDLFFMLGPSLTALIKDFSRGENVTLFMTFLAAFNILLYRYTGQNDIVVGTFSANRNRAEIEGLIGFFVNTLVLRTQVQPLETFHDLLQEIRTTCLDAYSHQDMPFEKLVEELRPSRDPSRNPFIQNTISFQGDPEKNKLSLAGLEIKREKIDNNYAKFDLYFELDDTQTGLILRINYNTALFNEDRIERMGRHYQALLEGLVRYPNQPIANLPMLTTAEHQQILVDWNSAEADYPDEACLHQLFEHYAFETPNELAVVLKDEKLTYAELDSLANKIANHLVGLGIGPESKVALLMDRSPAMIAAMLGVLKAGGAYVPMDTVLPLERLAYMLTDSESGLVLVNSNNVQKMTGLGTRVLCYEDILDGNTVTDKGTQINIASDNLAYVMYTSGSTGKPKGVMITHRNVVGFLYGYQPVTRDGPHRVGTSVAPFNFDTSTEEIYSNLCFGGTLHILLPEDSINAAWMARYLLNNSITTSYIVPDFLAPIASQIRQQGGDLKLKCLITGLAPKKESVLQPFRDLSSSLRILNAYGPTEVTYGATAYEFQEMKDAQHDVPIGIPFPNYQVYIVDINLQPVPVGVVGELLIAGVGISRGYYRRPGLTAEKFIPDPFGTQTGGRLYRSGDLARYLPDGNIEFLGRADDQVKVRGYRIELGEIETNLAACPLVRKCVVLARQDQPGDIRLVAYVVPTEGREPTSSELRNYLAASLPTYMLPNHFILLPEFPLMNNGKVNRKLLPAPDQSRPELDDVYQEPVTPTEVGLTNIWKKLLGIERIGIHDNFFELGGHSLLAIRMIGNTKKQMGFDLPLSAIFEAPTIHQLSKVLEAENWQPRWKALVAIQPAGDKKPLFLVPPSATTGDIFTKLANMLGVSQPVYSFNHLGMDGSQEPHNRIEDMAALYVDEMIAICPEGPYLLGGICFGNRVAVEMSLQLERRGLVTSSLILLDPGNNPDTGGTEGTFKKGAWYYFLKFFFNIYQGTIVNNTRRIINRKFKRYIKFRKANPAIRNTKRCHKQASLNYTLQPYPGRAFVIHSEMRKKKLELAWKKKLTGPVKYIEIPGSSHHTFLKKDEFLQAIAEHLNTYLDDLQRDQTTNESVHNKGVTSYG